MCDGFAALCCTVRARCALLQLTLTVQNLPLPVSGSYECSFTAENMTPRYTAASRQGAPRDEGNSTVLCDTPLHNLLPPISTGYGTPPLIAL